MEDTIAIREQQPPDRPNIAQDGFEIADCRGIKLLAIPYNNDLYICVHEISMALWKLFDTPRVSVQKKIIDLGIHLLQTTKSQVVILRQEGIIGNYRATMITLKDAERLYDALEYSRRKRGLVKHILKEPGKRATRAEEHGANKLRLTPRYKKDAAEYNFSPSAGGGGSTPCAGEAGEAGAHAHTLFLSPHKIPRDAPLSLGPHGCGLIGTPPASFTSSGCSANRAEEERVAEVGGGIVVNGLKIDVLFRAEDPVLAGGADCKYHMIDLLPNSITVEQIRNISKTHHHQSEPVEVRVQAHMDRVICCGPQQRLQSRSVTEAASNQITPQVRSQQQATSTRRKSKHHDPDYLPSAYAAKTSQSLPHSLQLKRSSRNREKDLQSSSTPCAGSSKFNPLRSRRLSSPPLELNDLEERSSVYSAVSRNSSGHQSSTPERFLFLDESSEGEEEESVRSSDSDDSDYVPEHSSSSEMRITVPGRGVSGVDRRVVKTKLRHFAHTTSPQFTALSRGKRLPQQGTCNSLTPSPSPASPLTISISLDELWTSERSQSSDVSSSNHKNSLSRKKLGRPPNNNNKTKARRTALSSFVMKKRASSPSMLSESGSPCPAPISVAPPPAKRQRICSSGSESSLSSSLSHASKSGREGVHALREEKSSEPPQQQREELTANDCLHPLEENLCKNSEKGDPAENQGEVGGASVSVPDDDQLSLTSASSMSVTMTTGHTSLSKHDNSKVKTPTANITGSTTSNGQPRRGRPPKNSTLNGCGLATNNVNSKKSTFNFSEFFSYYPPKLVVRDGELVPEMSLSVKSVDRANLSSLPENHPFLSWSLGTPVNPSVTLRGRKRKPPKAVRVT